MADCLLAEPLFMAAAVQQGKLKLGVGPANIAACAGFSFYQPDLFAVIPTLSADIGVAALN